MMLFLVSAHSIVESKRAHSGLLRTDFKSFGNKKLARLELWHMWFKCKNSVIIIKCYFCCWLFKKFRYRYLWFLKKENVFKMIHWSNLNSFKDKHFCFETLLIILTKFKYESFYNYWEGLVSNVWFLYLVLTYTQYWHSYFIF